MSFTVDSAGYMGTHAVARSLGMSVKRLGELRRKRPELFPNARKLSYCEYEYAASDVQAAREKLNEERRSKPLRGERCIEYRSGQGRGL